MKVVALVLGNLWMLPNTLFSAIYLGVFALMGWVRWAGFGRWSIKLEVVNGCWLDQRMGKGGWIAWASGVFTCYRFGFKDSVSTETHEERHVIQQMILGVLQPVMYFLSSVWLWLFRRDLHSYYDNPFERDARRAAGQEEDIPRSRWPNPNDRWSWW